VIVTFTRRVLLHTVKLNLVLIFLITVLLWGSEKVVIKIVSTYTVLPRTFVSPCA